MLAPASYQGHDTDSLTLKCGGLGPIVVLRGFLNPIRPACSTYLDRASAVLSCYVLGPVFLLVVEIANVFSGGMTGFTFRAVSLRPVP